LIIDRRWMLLVGYLFINIDKIGEIFSEGRNMIGRRVAIQWLASALCAAMTAGAFGAEAPSATSGTTPSYTYATNGVLNDVKAAGAAWRLLLNESNLGGQEVELAEVTIPAGSTVPSHSHGAVEVIYVLSGVYGHEVNGKLYRLKPGMVGIVRPGDHVRHLVSRAGDAKLLIIWAPAGEAAKVFRRAKGTTPDPVPPASSLDP
jgi:quercetin dioxygenase-like cupin family protein